jgi:hypothetical protein
MNSRRLTTTSTTTRDSGSVSRPSSALGRHRILAVMEIHIDKEGNITPRGAETFAPAILAPQAAEDKSPPKIVACSFQCPECDASALVEVGTPYDHNC